MYFNNEIKIYAETPPALFVAEFFRIELQNRNIKTEITQKKSNAQILLCSLETDNKDEYIIESDDKIIIKALGKRGLTYGVGHILRKMVKHENGFNLPLINGKFTPSKKIRGHQLGYRTTPNTYDAWSYEDYRKYSLELMYFGMNVIEHIPYQKGVSRRNKLMKYDEEEFLINACKLADEYDLDVSLWHPNYDNETMGSAVKEREEIYSKLKRLDYVFIPGGDPGELPADEFIDRCIAISKVLKKIHPKAEMWPSAQMPHSIPNWAEVFIDKMKELPEEIDGIIYGPNHALPLEELREKLPSKYPLRFYPDITHNVRCEYPVHFEKNDWHYAFAVGLSRESTNPRPREYAYLYEITKDYFIGSVSYSEGVTDDVNKAVFSALDFNENTPLEEIIDDYCRLFFYGCPTKKISKLIFSLEENWVGNPLKNDSIENIYSDFIQLYSEYPSLQENWRFLQLLLRSECDMLIRYRMMLEYDMLDECEICLENNDFAGAVNALNAPYSRAYNMLREDISETADKLFNLIGLQLDVEHYGANSWERGAILETIDLPVTDRAYLRNKAMCCNSADELKEYFYRNSIKDGEFYYSVALHGLKEPQKGEIYMNFRGDNPNENNGELPTSLFNVFDNQTFSMEIDGLKDRDYILRITYLNKTDENVDDLKILVNDNIVYEGKQFGKIDRKYTEKFCTPKYITAKYAVPKEFINKGKTKIYLSEPKMCVMFSEISMKYE